MAPWLHWCWNWKTSWELEILRLWNVWNVCDFGVWKLKQKCGFNLHDGRLRFASSFRWQGRHRGWNDWDARHSENSERAKWLPDAQESLWQSHLFVTNWVKVLILIELYELFILFCWNEKNVAKVLQSFGIDDEKRCRHGEHRCGWGLEMTGDDWRRGFWRLQKGKTGTCKQDRGMSKITWFWGSQR